MKTYFGYFIDKIVPAITAIIGVILLVKANSLMSTQNKLIEVQKELAETQRKILLHKEEPIVDITLLEERMELDKQYWIKLSNFGGTAEGLTLEHFSLMSVDCYKKSTKQTIHKTVYFPVSGPSKEVLKKSFRQGESLQIISNYDHPMTKNYNEWYKFISSYSSDHFNIEVDGAFTAFKLSYKNINGDKSVLYNFIVRKGLISPYLFNGTSDIWEDYRKILHSLTKNYDPDDGGPLIYFSSKPNDAGFKVWLDREYK